MERRIDLHLHVSYEPRAVRPWLVLCLLLLSAGELGSENVTLTTYYPAPSGAYTKMITTSDTYLARDNGSVGVGTASPGVKFQVNGGTSRFAGNTTGVVDIFNTSGAAEGGTIKLVGNNGTAQYIENYSGDLRVVNSAWTAENMRISDSAGNLSVRGNVAVSGSAPGSRAYLYVNSAGGGGSACTLTSTNNGSCVGQYITWVPGIYVQNSYWYSGPNLNFTTVGTPLGNQTNVTTTAPYYYCCAK